MDLLCFNFNVTVSNLKRTTVYRMVEQYTQLMLVNLGKLRATKSTSKLACNILRFVQVASSVTHLRRAKGWAHGHRAAWPPILTINHEKAIQRVAIQWKWHQQAIPNERHQGHESCCCVVLLTHWMISLNVLSIFLISIHFKPHIFDSFRVCVKAWNSTWVDKERSMLMRVKLFM